MIPPSHPEPRAPLCKRCGAKDYGNHKGGKCPRCRAETSNHYDVGEPIRPLSAPAASGTPAQQQQNDEGWTKNDQPQEPEPSLDAIRGILAGYTRVGPESDAERIEWLEAQGVVSIYLRDGRQLNPASMSVRAAIDTAMGGENVLAR